MFYEAQVKMIMMTMMMKAYHATSLLGENNVKNKNKLNQRITIFKTFTKDYHS